MLWYNHSSEQMCLLIFKLISQVSVVAHGPLIFEFLLNRVGLYEDSFAKAGLLLGTSSLVRDVTQMELML